MRDTLGNFVSTKAQQLVEDEEDELDSDYSPSEKSSSDEEEEDLEEKSDEEFEATDRIRDARKQLRDIQNQWRTSMQNLRNMKRDLVKYVSQDPACRDLPEAERQTMANTLAVLLLKAQDLESGEFWTDENLRRVSMKQKPTIYCQGAENWFKPKTKGWVADAWESVMWSSLGLIYSQIGLTGLRFVKESEEAFGHWATL